ncbi:Ras GTPase-activating protein-binding protein isoform 3 [Schistosoma japonicum]|uniref:Ras GTPase-activating protein-binding protein isoform 3 n=1 Tax=Schistosoma japonicum TaxID=6182 RepID=A0A4Z2D559_SCHJA|nr:Ras GTPase-activating protein-binding protein isoform 3 [Schistosoma japonicum]
MVSVVENNASPDSAFTVVRMEPSDILSLAGQFVVQYYTVMKKCPSGIHRFYKDDSSMIREDTPVCGQRMIHEKIMSMNLQGSQIAILKLDALRANGNSVLIHVAGEMSVGNEEFRRFTQCFILREQAPCDFYVLNDIFRYQDYVYGDVKTNAETNNGHSTKMNEYSPSENTSHCSIPHSSRDDHTHSWEGVSDGSYKQTIDEIQSRDSEAKQDQLTVDHTVPHSSTSSVHQELVNNTDPPAPPAVQSGQRSWAQMASKQPQAVLNTQAPKGSRTNAVITEYDGDERHRGGLRQTADGPQRVRSMGQRQQSDSRGISEMNYAQDNRTASRGNALRSSGFSGSARGGGRGGRGGMGNGSTGGRGSGVANPRRAS